MNFSIAFLLILYYTGIVAHVFLGKIFVRDCKNRIVFCAASMRERNQNNESSVGLGLSA